MTEKKNTALQRAKAKYRREKVSTLQIDLYQTDEDIKTHLSQLQEPKATYIKRLIREDIARGNKS